MPNIPKLLDWYDKSHRDLPWRRTRDPYKIWLSEIILQQTRVDQGLSYYQAFVSHFPNIKLLAAANEDTVLKLWQGLGYYSRARNMHHTAKFITQELGGKFPDNYDDILKLKGVGPYTAAAISSIVFDEVRPVMDGNVMRVISRWFAILDAVDSSRGKKQIEALLNTLIDNQQPGKFNQALMEFGATWCKPKNPDCTNCIFAEKCAAFKQKSVSELPVKKGKTRVRERFFYYLVFRFDDETGSFTLLKKRSDKDIWEGLYEFPLLELNAELSTDSVLNVPQFNTLVNKDTDTIKHISQPMVHQLSHQKITARFLMIESKKAPLNQSGHFLKVPVSELHKYPISRLISKFLESNPV